MLCALWQIFSSSSYFKLKLFLQGSILRHIFRDLALFHTKTENISYKVNQWLQKRLGKCTGVPNSRFEESIKY